MRPPILLSIAHLLFFTKSIQAASCYTVDGTQYTDSSYVPCDANAQTSACCASDKGTRSDICMSSGLCYAQDSGFRGLIYMNGCTDSTGLSADCPHICPDATTNWGGGSKVASWNVLQCDKGTYCCREASNTTNCCDDEAAIVQTDIGTLLVSTKTATSTVGTAAAATVTLTVTAAAEETSAGNRSNSTASAATCSKDKTALVGGAVGGALGAALLASVGALAFLMMRDRGRRDGVSYPTAATSTTARSPHFPEQQSKPVQYHDGSFVPPQELPSAGSAPYEMR